MLIELAAVALALGYVLLAIRESRLCWIAGGLSAALYTSIFWQVALYMEAVLQLFYIAMSIYGWWSWTDRATHEAAAIQRWSLRSHAAAAALLIALSAAFGFGLAQYTDAAAPYLDSFTTVAAIFTTWLVAKKVLENWLYWIVIDAVSIYLYVGRGLDMTAVLFAGYLLLALAGYLEWRRNFLNCSSRDLKTA